MRRNSTILVVVLAVVVSAAGVGALTAFDGGDTAVAAQNVSDSANATDEPDRRIHVSATGEAQAQPNQAVVRVAVTAEADSVGTIRDRLANGSDELTSALDELGAEYETTRYDISEHTHRREQQSPFDYEGTHTYEITVDDPDLAGEVVDTAAGAGAEIETVVLTLSEQRREQLRDTAIENAIRDASNQSAVIADTSGLDVVAPVSVDASQRGFAPVPFESAQTEGDSGGGPPTEIESGTVSVTYEVDVTYEAVRD
ncbi:MAG: hypothetical protein ACI8TL_001540 [Natronomonas sp.]|jgi:uncharacterized protein YggE